MSANERPDFFEERLRPKPLPPNEPLQQKLLKQTLSQVRWRLWRRRLWYGAALAACYLAGFLSHAWQTANPGIPPKDSPGLPRPQEASPTSSPPLEEQAKRAAPADQATLFRKAGDSYLGDRDPLAAIQCYSKALKAHPEESKHLAPEDSWLMMALKNAREQEMIDANATP